MPGTVNLIDPSGRVHAFDESDAAGIDAALRAQWKPEGDVAGFLRAGQERRVEDRSGLGGAALATGAAAARGLSFGTSDALARAIGGDLAAYELSSAREAHPDLSTGVELGAAIAPALLSGGAGTAGALARATPAGMSARLGAALARTGEGAGLGARVLRGAAGGAVDAGLQNAGTAISDLALAQDPIEMERAVGLLSSRFFSGAALGAPIGGTLGALEHGLTRYSARLKAIREGADAAPAGAIPDDVAALDAGGVREARKVEVARIEAEVVTPARQGLVTDVKAWRDATNESRPWDALATGSKETRDAAKVAAKKAERVAKKAEARVAELEAGGGGTAVGDLIDETGAKALTWKEFNSGERMKAALAETGNMPAAHKKIGADWQAYKAKLRRAEVAAAVDGTELVAARTAAENARKAADEAAVELQSAAAQVRERAPKWVRDAGAKYIKADRKIDSILNNMEGLAETGHGGPALRGQLRDALQRQRQVLQEMSDKADELRKLHALDTTPRRAEALAAVDDTLARNRALQERLDALAAPPVSPRLEALDAHLDALKAPRTGPTTAAKVKAAGAFAAVSAAGHAVLPGFASFAIAPLGALAAAKALGDKAAPALLAAAKASAERTGRAVDAFLTVTKGAKKLAPKLVPESTRVLGMVRFAPERPREKEPRTLQEHARARMDELASVVQQTPAGPKVRRGTREAIAAKLAPIAAVAPHVADKLETLAVRRLEFLASKMPKVIQLGLTEVPPDELAVRAWARYVAAAEDPDGIEERLAHGIVTPEDAEVMRVLYPGRFASLVASVMGRLGELRETLPYERRLNLSMFTGAPVEAALTPHILAGIQSSFVSEFDTDGGTRAPRPRPTVGSLKKPEQPTRAQRRAG